MSFTTPLSTLISENFNGLLGQPPHWHRAALGDIATITNGVPLPSTGFNPSKGAPVVRIRNVVEGSTETFFDGPVEEGWFIAPGDLLVGMDGDFNLARWRGPRALLNQRVCHIAPKDERVSIQYLSYVLPGYLTAVNKHTPSITVKHLSSKTVAELPIPVPPLGEQAALVAAIDAHFSRLDATVASLTRAKANLKLARASVLKAAVEGRLVPTEAELAQADMKLYEPASVLLERILVERKAKWESSGKKRKYKEPVAPETEGLPELPEGWVWATPNQAFAWSSGEFLPKKSHSGGKIPVYGGNGTNGLHSVSNSKEPTIVIGRVGAHCGNISVTSGEAWITDNAIYSCVTPASVLLLYWHFALSALNINSKAAGSGQPYVNQSLLGSLLIRLPPLAEQRRIVDEVERRLSILSTTETQLEASVAHCDLLRQSILKQAFEGKLVK